MSAAAPILKTVDALIMLSDVGDGRCRRAAERLRLVRIIAGKCGMNPRDADFTGALRGNPRLFGRSSDLVKKRE